MATKDMTRDRNVGVYDSPKSPAETRGTTWIWWALAIVLLVLLAMWLF